MPYLERVTWVLEGDGLEGQKWLELLFCKKGLASVVRYYNPQSYGFSSAYSFVLRRPQPIPPK